MLEEIVRNQITGYSNYIKPEKVLLNEFWIILLYCKPFWCIHNSAIMKPVWSLNFWSLLEARISKIKVIGFMGQSCHSVSSGYLSNHEIFMDHESDISCNEMGTLTISQEEEITVPWGHHHTATMHQLQEQEEQQQGKAIQLRRVSATTPRRLASARTEVRLTDAGSNGERVWSLSWGNHGSIG